MRTTVLILALLGGATSGFLGWKWFSDSRGPEVKAARDLIALASQIDGAASAEAKAKLAELDRMVLAAYFLMAAAGLGIVGGVLAYTGKGMVAAIVLILAAAVPGALAPMSLVFSCPLVLAGLLSFLIRPAAPARSAA